MMKSTAPLKIKLLRQESLCYVPVPGNAAFSQKNGEKRTHHLTQENQTPTMPLLTTSF
jgi:hypothetical protein